MEIPGEGFARGRFFSRNPVSGTKRASAEVFFDAFALPGTKALPLLAFTKNFPQASQRLEEQALYWESSGFAPWRDTTTLSKAQRPRPALLHRRRVEFGREVLRYVGRAFKKVRAPDRASFGGATEG